MSKQKYPTAGTATSLTTGAKVRPGGYSHSFLDSRQESRRLDAEQRNEHYHSLSLADRLSMIKFRNTKLGGESKREVARIEKLIANQKPAAIKKAPMTEAIAEGLAAALELEKKLHTPEENPKSKYRAKKATAVKKEKKAKSAKKE